MPRKTYRIEWPLYQESKEYQEAKKAKAKATPQRALTKTALYWPPEALAFAYAIACIDIVLLRSREASAAYYEAIKALELPGCQALIKKAKVQAPDTNAWSIKTIKKLLEKGIKSLGKGKDIPSLPWLTTIEQYKDNADFLHFYERVGEFIRVGFNRQADLAEKRPKVLAEKAPNLFGATVIRLIAEYCEVKLKDWNKYRPDGVDNIMASSDPTTRADRDKVRLKKREIRQVYKLFKWVLRRNAKLIKYAAQWYKCRVNPGTIEAYRDELVKDDKYLERSNIETAIAPYDEATGYPRNWRK